MSASLATLFEYRGTPLASRVHAPGLLVRSATWLSDCVAQGIFHGAFSRSPRSRRLFMAGFFAAAFFASPGSRTNRITAATASLSIERAFLRKPLERVDASRVGKLLGP